MQLLLLTLECTGLAGAAASAHASHAAAAAMPTLCNLLLSLLFPLPCAHYTAAQTIQYKLPSLCGTLQQTFHLGVLTESPLEFSKPRSPKKHSPSMKFMSSRLCSRVHTTPRQEYENRPFLLLHLEVVHDLHPLHPLHVHSLVVWNQQ